MSSHKSDRLRYNRRDGFLWQTLRGSAPLRSALYFFIELKRVLKEDKISGIAAFEEHFREVDPWNYEKNPRERERFVRQAELLDRVRDGALFRRAVEIGCAEGHFTEFLAERCQSLRALELSPTALERAKARRVWPPHVQFQAFDLRCEPLPGPFDVVIVASVLEYFSRRRTFAVVRAKLAAATAPGGHLLICTTRRPSVVEDAWWARHLIRGRWINAFIARHRALKTVHTHLTDHICVTLLEKTTSR